MNVNAIPPNDKETEQAVLGAMMLDQRAREIAQQDLLPEHFYDGNHQTLFTVLCEIPGPIDLVIVKNYLKIKEISICGIGGERANGDVLARMCEGPHCTANIEEYCKALQEWYRDRKSKEIAQKLHAESGTHNSDQRIERAKAELEQITPKETRRNHSAELRAEIDAEIDGTRSGLDHPFFSCLTKTNCFLPGTVTILCGSPGASKSLWALEAVWQLVWSGVAATMLALESGWKLHARRALSQIASNSRISDWRFARDKPDEMRALLDGVAEHERTLIDRKVIQTTETGDVINAQYLLSWLNAMGKAGFRFVVIDPITKLRSAGRDKWAEQEKFMAECGDILIKWKMSLLIVTHPKTADRKGTIAISLDNMAGLPDFRQFADSVFWLDSHQSVKKSFRVDACYDEEQSFNRTMHCKKARLGPMCQRVAYEMSGFTLRHVQRGYIQ